jgi:hypothetical protein
MADYHFKSKGRDHWAMTGPFSPAKCRRVAVRGRGPQTLIGAGLNTVTRAALRLPGPWSRASGVSPFKSQVTGPTLSLPIGKDSEYPAAPSPLTRTPSRRRMIGPGPAWAGPGPGCLFLLPSQYPPRHPNLTQARPSG